MEGKRGSERSYSRYSDSRYETFSSDEENSDLDGDVSMNRGIGALRPEELTQEAKRAIKIVRKTEKYD